MPRKVTTSAPKSPRMSTPAFVGVIAVAGIIVIGGAILIGRSDSGEINVAAAIQNSNQANLENGGDPNNQIETTSQAFRNMPNGGLVPSGNTAQPQTETPQTEEVVSETTTEEVTEGGEESPESNTSESGEEGTPDAEVTPESTEGE